MTQLGYGDRKTFVNGIILTNNALFRLSSALFHGKRITSAMILNAACDLNWSLANQDLFADPRWKATMRRCPLDTVHVHRALPMTYVYAYLITLQRIAKINNLLGSGSDDEWYTMMGFEEEDDDDE